jgi:anti-sigma regulatory factor (Ser/Thr protein kinase)
VASIDLPPERAAAARARRFVRSTCVGWAVADRAVEDIELLVSELVTNAVRHARSRANLKIERRDDVVRVTVSDESGAVPQLRDYGPEAIAGRGVLIIDRVARDWGVDSLERGKRVWFEVEVEPAGERTSR